MRELGSIARTALVCLAVTAGANAAFQEDSGPASKVAANQIAPIVTGQTSSEASVPPLVRFAGILKDASGKPLAGQVDVTFAIYKEEEEGEPLWQETQTVQADEQGHYTVFLGAMQPEGLPEELFTSGEARWLGVSAGKLPEQPRVLLVSVPYALKANDAVMLGGKPASAYMLAQPGLTSSGETFPPGRVAAAPDTANPPKPKAGPKDNVVGTGVQNFIPVWTDSAGTLGNSVMFQYGTNVGIGTTTPGYLLDVMGGSARLTNPSGTTQFMVAGSASTGRFGQDSVGPFLSSDSPGAALRFLVNNGALNESMRISGTGLVGVGTPAPQAMLDVNNTLRAGGLNPGANGVLFIGPDNLDSVHQVDNQAGSGMHFRLSRPTPDASGGTDFLIAPYTYGESISYNGLIEFSSAGLSVRGLPGLWPGSLNIDNSTDSGSLFMLGDDQGPEIISDHYDGTSAGPITFGVINPTDSFIFGQCISNCTDALDRPVVTKAAQITASGGIQGSSLQATANAPNALGPTLTLTNTGGGAGAMTSVDLNTSAPSGTGTPNPMSRIAASDDGDFSDSLVFATNNPGALNNGLVERMRITSGGAVGIDTSTPAHMLDVVGDINASTNISAGGNLTVTGTITGNGSGLTGVSASGLSCTGCVGNTQLGVNYAASASQGGAATNALALNGLASSAFQLAGSYATLGANTFTGTETVNGQLNVGSTAPVSALNVAGTTGLTWTYGATPSSALVTVGTGGTSGGSLYVSTPSLNSNYQSGLGIDGTYGTPSQQSVINIRALGVQSGGGYGSQLAFWTTNGTALNQQMTITSAGLVGIGTATPAHVLDVVGDINASTNISAGGNLTVTGTITGNGSGLTSLNASDLGSGTVPTAALSGTYSIAISGNAASATNAANSLELGGVAAGHYARLDIGNSFTGNQTVTGNLSTTGSVSASSASLSGALTIGGGTPITEHLSTTSTLSYPAFAPQSCNDLTISIPGAAEGDTVALGIPNVLGSLMGVSWSGWASASGQVTVRGCNATASTKSAPLSATVRVDVWKH